KARSRGATKFVPTFFSRIKWSKTTAPAPRPATSRKSWTARSTTSSRQNCAVKKRPRARRAMKFSSREYLSHFRVMKHTSLAALLLFSATCAQTISARLMYDWSYQELFDKSDFVVIANPVSRTKGTDERTVLREMQENVIGVETQFETQVVLKGGKRDRFVLHHYRPVPSRVAEVNGPSFIRFDPKHA